MKISLIGHAAILVEARGVRILSDPWWEGPCFGAQWWLHPAPWLEPLGQAPPDFIYISHGHSDHLHAGTLRRLPKSAKVIVSAEGDTAEPIRQMGFDVLTLDPRERREIADGVHVEIAPTYGDDTLMVVGDGEETCINLNDALHAAPQRIQRDVTRDLAKRYGRADYVFCGYGTASHFPNCYRIPGKDDAATAIKRQHHFNLAWVSLVAALAPRFAFPFAADVVLLDDELFWANEPVRNHERVTDLFRRLHPAASTQVYDAAPGFVVASGAVAREVLFERVSADELRMVNAAAIATANQFTVPSRAQIEELAGALRQNAAMCGRYLAERPGDYSMMVLIKGAQDAIRIAKSDAGIGVAVVPAATAAASDLVFTTRYSYLRRALTGRYGHETIFVGSGGSWSYRDRAVAATNLHRELAVLLHKHSAPPPSRFGDQPSWLFHLKRAIKRALGKRSDSFYDLNAWTVYEARS